jgi:hypothetical protein
VKSEADWDKEREAFFERINWPNIRQKGWYESCPRPKCWQFTKHGTRSWVLVSVFFEERKITVERSPCKGDAWRIEMMIAQLKDWRKEKWHIFASETRGRNVVTGKPGRRYTLEANMSGDYKVTCDGGVVWGPNNNAREAVLSWLKNWT